MKYTEDIHDLGYYFCSKHRCKSKYKLLITNILCYAKLKNFVKHKFGENIAYEDF